MKLYFVGGYDHERELCSPSTIQEAMAAIQTFIKEHNYKSYYTRAFWTEENGGTIHYDVGSWSQFFELRGVPQEAVQ